MTSAIRAAENKSSRKKAGAFKLEGAVIVSVKFPENVVESPKSECLCHFFEDMVDIRAAKDILLGIAASKSVVGGGSEPLPQCIVFAPLLGVRKDGVSFIDQLHFFGGFWIPLISVRVIFKGQMPIGLFDLFLSGIFFDPQYLVIISLGHVLKLF
jgi:hypothetical protein